MALNNEKAIVEIGLNGKPAENSLKALQREASSLRATLSRLPADSQEFIDKTKKFQEVNSRVKAIKNDVNGLSNTFATVAKEQTTLFDKFKVGVGAVFGGNLLTSAIGSIKSAFTNAINVQREFEKSLKNLSAITGATGKDLEFYKEQAIDMGAKVEGGAKAVVEAFKFIGSAKPELLQNKEALAQLTRQAILLSQAAGIDLPEASLRLTDAMNQFGAPAKDAAKYVDALAAGAKYGAAEIPDITDALLKFGVAAKSSNITVYESVAAIELLGEKGLKGAEAGTQLRNIFAKLAAADILPKEALSALQDAGVNIDILKNKSIPLADRLKELSKIQGDASAITRVFGLENKNAGEALITNIDRLSQLTTQVQENGVAMEQATKNMDTLDQAMLEAGNAWDNMLLSFTSGDFGEVIKGFVKKATEGLNELKVSISAFGTLFKTGSLFKAADTMAEQNILAMHKRVVSQMSEESRKKAIVEEKRLVDAMLYALKFSKNVSVEEKEDYAKKIKFKIELLKELNKYENKTNSKATNNTLPVNNQSTLNTENNDKNNALPKNYNKKIEDAYAKHKLEIENIDKEFNNRKLTQVEKERKAIENKYKNVLSLEKEGSEERKRLQNQLDTELAEFDTLQNEKFIQSKKEAQDKIKRLTQTNEQNEIDEVEKKYKILISDAVTFGIDTVALEQARQIELLSIKEKYNQKEIDDNNKKNQKLTEQEKAHKEKRQASFQDYYQAVSGLLSAWNESQQLQANTREAEIKAKTSKELEMEKRLLNAKVIGQAEYNRRTKKLEEQQRKEVAAVKKKAAENEKKVAIFNALISGGVAVGRAFADYKYPASLIIAALVAATTALNISNISNQKVPEYAQGGLHASGNPQGMVNKPTYFTNSSSGMNFIAGEKGAEWIAPNWMLQNPVTANTIGMLEAIRQRGYANGGLTTAVPIGEAKTSSSNSPNFSNVSYSNADLVNAVNTLNGILASGIMAKLSYDQFNKDISSINSAQQSAQVRS